MNTKSLKATNLQERNSLPASLELRAGSLSKFWSGLERIISGSPDRQVVINLTVNIAQGGGATIHYTDKR